MAVVGSIGIGTFFFILFILILIITYIIGHKTRTGKIVFSVLLIIFVITFACLMSSPLEGQSETKDTVKKWPVLTFFSLAIFIGLIFSFCAYFSVVILHEDNVVKIPA